MARDCGTPLTTSSHGPIRAKAGAIARCLTIGYVCPSSERGEPLVVPIVTPTLNQGRFIDGTIRSIKSQTYRNLEHIVVDGGSTDDTHKVLRRHEGTYPMRWTSEPDRGMYDAVNKGLRLAHGDILAYLNSDDLYFPWTLSTVVNGFGRHPDAGAVYGDSIKIELDTGRQHALFGLPFNTAVLAQAGPWAGMIIQPTVFWQRRTMDSVGAFDERLRYVGDREFFLRVGRAFPMRRLDEFLAIELKHDQALTISQQLALEAEDDAVLPRRDDWRSKALVRGYGARWRRVLWFQFLLAWLTRDPGGPWAGLLSDGGTRVSPLRGGLGQTPGVGRWILPNAIRVSPRRDGTTRETERGRSP